MRFEIPSSSASSPVAKIPDRFGEYLARVMGPDAVIRFLAYAPEFETAGTRWPGSLLTLGKDSWCLVSSRPDGNLIHVASSSADTVLVERTAILLYGQLRIDYAVEGHTVSATAEFNNVDDRRYHEAVLQLLAQMEQQPISTRTATDIPSEIKSIPFKFQNAVVQCVPAEHSLLGVVAWPAVLSGLRRELAPAAALVCTNSELIILSDDHGFASRLRDENQKYGTIATYFPASRLAEAKVMAHGRFHALELTLHARHGGETVEVFIPSSAANAVADALRSFEGRAHG